jgi:hypothetical protein
MFASFRGAGVNEMSTRIIHEKAIKSIIWGFVKFLEKYEFNSEVEHPEFLSV